ncbi:tRNA pseudouridine(55) synthase [Gammaproteobacteria bacterium]
MKRNVNGVLLLDKPIGVTSNEVLQLVKRLFSANKAGHTGSLDPIATGMLPICFGEATKFSQFLLEANKHYVVTGKLGETTASADSEGAILQKREVKNIEAQTIEKILPKFQGKILQVPPMYSALKYKGQPLYKLARQGIEIEREPREVTVHMIRLLELNGDLAEFEMRCSKGTYVRTIVADIGELLGCGAHVIALRRLAVGPYQTSQMVTVTVLQELAAKNDYKLLDQLLLPIESMLVDMPEVTLTADMVFYMHQGQPLIIPKAPDSGLVKMKSKSGQFLGVGEVMLDGKITPRRMCV